MNTALAIVALLVLVAGGAYVIHRLNSAHAERIAERSYSRFRPGRQAAPDRAADATAPSPPSSAPATPHERRDHRDGGRGRLRPRHRRDRTTHRTPTSAERRYQATRQD